MDDRGVVIGIEEFARFGVGGGAEGQNRALRLRKGEPLASTRGVDRPCAVTAEPVFELTAAAGPGMTVAADIAAVD